jgi:hypothetical protein
VPPTATRIRYAPLASLAAVVTVAAAVGWLPPRPGLTHAVGLPPLDLVHDLGALLVWSPNGVVFVIGAALSLTVRSVVLAAVLGGVDRVRLRRAATFYLVVWPPSFVAAALLYSAKAVLFYLLFWAGAVVSVVLVLGTAAVPWSGPASRLRDRFARSARGGFRVGTVGAYLAALTVVGYLADVSAPVGPVVLVPVSAALTGVAARCLLDDPGWRAVRRSVAAVPAAGVLALVVVVLTGPPGPERAETPTVPRAGSIMLMSGIDSSSGRGAILEIDPHLMGWTCERTYYFSYAGPGDGQPRNDALCPITDGAPYEAVDTMRSREELVPFLEAQVAQMEAPAVVAGHSQGVWITWEAAADDRLGPVETIILVGPFPENPVSYPTDEEVGLAHVGRAVLFVVTQAPRPGGTTAFEPDTPLGHEWLADPDRIEDTLARPLPEGIRALSIASSFDLPMMSDDHRLPGAVNACPVPVIHPNLPYSTDLQELVVGFVDGEDLGPCPWWRSAIGPLFRHFAVPPSHW